MASDEEDVPAWGGAIQSAISQASDEEDEEGVNVVSGGGLTGDEAEGSGDMPYLVLLKGVVAGLKAGVVTEEQFVEGVSKLDAITDNALRLYEIPAVKKDLPGKLTEHQNDLVGGLEAEVHRLKEGLTILLNYPNTKNEADLDAGLQLCSDAMYATREIKRAATVEAAAIEERKKEEKARRAQAAAAEDDEE